METAMFNTLQCFGNDPLPYFIWVGSSEMLGSVLNEFWGSFTTDFNQSRVQPTLSTSENLILLVSIYPFLIKYKEDYSLYYGLMVWKKII